MKKDTKKQPRKCGVIWYRDGKREVCTEPVAYKIDGRMVCWSCSEWWSRLYAKQTKRGKLNN